MSRRSLLLTIGILALVVWGTALVLFLLVRHEPRHYLDAAVPPGPERTDLSKAFFKECSQFISAIGNGGEWYGLWTDRQINSFFEEEFVHQGFDGRLLPEGVSQPRVIIEPNLLRLGFRYGSGAWSTVVSLDLAVWLPKGEANAVVFELIGFHAGALPISTQSLLERVFEVARQNGFEVSWYRYNGHPTALLRFQADQSRTALQLKSLELGQGTITILGSTGEAGPTRAMLDALPQPRD
jgi:hypothetical protein